MSLGRALARIVYLGKTVLRGGRAYKAFLRDWVALADLDRSVEVLHTMRFSQAPRPALLQGPDARQIVVLSPHPDDEAIGPGGTLVRATEASGSVLCVHITDGVGLGTEVLREEASAAAREGKYGVRFLGHPLRRIPLDRPALQELAEAVTSHRPEVLMLPFLLDDHDDHRRVNHMVWEAYKVGLLPANLEIWAYQVYTPLPGNVVVDITDQVGRKAALIRCYASQMRRRDWAHFAVGLNAFNSRFLPESTTPRYAELFTVLPLKDYAELCALYFSGDSAACYYSPDYRGEGSWSVTH